MSETTLVPDYDSLRRLLADEANAGIGDALAGIENGSIVIGDDPLWVVVRVDSEALERLGFKS